MVLKKQIFLTCFSFLYCCKGRKIKIIKIRINPERSPLNLLKNKFLDKKEKKKHREQIKRVELMDEKIMNVDDFFDDETTLSTKYEPSPKQNRLLKMMYLDDIDVDYVKTKMKVTDEELEFMVDELVELGFLEYSSDDEVELTDEAIYYITSRDLDLL